MLRFSITDLQGVGLATFFEHQGGEVAIAINAARTAKLKVSAHDPAVLALAPLKRMMKVTYNQHLIFWGVILTLSWQSGSSDATVEINAHDQSIWWKKNYHRYGDIVVDNGYRVGGKGIRRLAESAIPLPHQVARGVKHPGIVWGSDTSIEYKYNSVMTLVPGSGPRPTKLASPVANDGVWAQETRGQNVMDSIDSLVSAVIGPEWELNPIDAAHPGSGAYPAATTNPYYAELNTYERQGADKTATVIWHRGFGKNNLDEMTWEPNGDLVRNYQVVVWPGGEASRRDSKHKALSHDEASWLELGIYQGWEVSQTKDSQKLLQAKADTYVKTYTNPLDVFTIVPSRERTGTFGGEEPYRYMDHFKIGDTITAIVRHGYMQKTLTGRVMSVTLSVDGSGGTVSTSLDCVPSLGPTFSNVDELG